MAQRSKVDDLDELVAHMPGRRRVWRQIGETWYVSILADSGRVSSRGHVIIQGKGATREDAASAALDNLSVLRLPPGWLR